MLKAGEVEAPGNNGQNPYTTIVDEAEGLDKLKQMETHQDDDVYKKAMHILETYFGVDDEEDESLQPESTQQGFVFQSQQGAGFQFG